MVPDARRHAASVTQPIRVLFVSATAARGGALRSLQVMMESLSRLDVRCHLAGPAGLSALAACEAGVCFIRAGAFDPVRRASLSKACRLAVRWLCALIGVARAIASCRPDVVHANTTAAMLVALLPARLVRRPVIWHVRDLAPLDGVGRFLGRHAAAVIAVSEAVRRHLIRSGVEGRRIHVIHNGLDLRQTAPREPAEARRSWRDRLGLPRSAFLFLNVGQYVSWKRQELFLAAAARVAARYPQVCFLIVGGSPAGGGSGCRPELERLSRRPGLAGRTVLLDWQDDMVSLYACCDALVHAAPGEPFGRVLIEGMDAGLPVIAADGGGAQDIIEPVRSGLLVEPENVDALAAAMIAILHDKVLAARLAEAGRRRARACFSASRTGRRVRDIYQSVLRRTRVRPFHLSMACGRSG